MRGAKTLLKAVVPRVIQDAARQVVYRHKPLGRPFPFLVGSPEAADTLNCCIAYNTHGGYCVPLSGRHRPAVRHVLAGEVWEAATIALIASRYAGGDIVHAGTYFGDFLPALSHLATDAGEVWAFEPNSESYRCARVTIEINDLRNVRLMHAALGERTDTRDLVVVDNQGRTLGGASHIAADATADWAESTLIVTLDAIVPESRTVSLIHLDVEGYEQHALSGAMGIVRRCRPLLVLETLPEAGWMVQNLTPLGYRQETPVADNFVLSCAR